MRVGVIVALAALLGGCVTTQNTLSPERRAAIRLDSVKVVFAPNAPLAWAEAESEYDRSKDPNAGLTAYTTAGPLTGERRAYVEKKAAARIAAVFEKRVLPEFRGTEPARLEIVVKAMDLPGGARRALIGGDHTLRADISVVNARTGEVIIQAPDFQALSQGGGMISLVADTMLPDPVDRVSTDLSNRYKNWLKTGSESGLGF